MIPILQSARPKILERLNKHIDKLTTPDCWIWTGRVDKKTKQCMTYYKKARVSARRFIYEVINDPVKEDLVLWPTCTTKHCVNPAHMKMVTHQKLGVLANEVGLRQTPIDIRKKPNNRKGGAAPQVRAMKLRSRSYKKSTRTRASYLRQLKHDKEVKQNQELGRKLVKETEERIRLEFHDPEWDYVEVLREHERSQFDRDNDAVERDKRERYNWVRRRRYLDSHPKKLKDD